MNYIPKLPIRLSVIGYIRIATTNATLDSCKQIKTKKEKKEVMKFIYNYKRFYLTRG